MTTLVKLTTKYGKPFTCICGCSTFKQTISESSHAHHCSQCGMYCGQRRIK